MSVDYEDKDNNMTGSEQTLLYQRIREVLENRSDFDLANVDERETIVDELAIVIERLVFDSMVKGALRLRKEGKI